MVFNDISWRGLETLIGISDNLVILKFGIPKLI